MPQDFENCVKNGGKVRRKSLKGGKYINICYDKKGNSYSGEVMTKKKDSKEKSTQETIEESRKLAESLRELQKHFHDNYRV